MNLLSYLPQLPQAWDQHGTSTWTVSCIDVEPILLGSGGDAYAIANLLAQHGHSELKDLTVTPQVFITITTKLIPWLIWLLALNLPEQNH